MKLAVCVLASVLALSGLAFAEDTRRPNIEQRHKNKQLGRALMDHFDANGDGKLGPRERMRAARVLAKVQRKLAGKQGRPMREKLIRRFDRNGDGHLDESELPPKVARKLRRFDRDRDGWVEPGELR